MNLKKTLPCSIGIVLALQGINIIALFKVLVGKNLRILSPIMMAVTILLLLDYDRLREMRFSRYNKSMAGIALYLAVITAISFFSEGSLMLPTYGFLYQLMYFVTILALWNNDDRLDLTQCFNILYWASFAICFLALILILLNYRSTGNAFFQGLGRDSAGQIIITRASTASIAFVLAAAVLARPTVSVGDRIRIIVFMAIAVVVIFLSRRRGIYLATLLIFAFWMIKHRQKMNFSFKKSTILRALLLSMCLILLLLFLMGNRTTAEILQKGVSSLTKGVSTYLGRSDVDVAARIRYERLQKIPYEYIFESSVFHFLFGNGYMTEWLDLPLVQAFNDLGFIGGIAFLVVYLILPARNLFIRAEDPLVAFAQYLSLSCFLNVFSSGVPYGSTFFPVALLVYVVKRAQEQPFDNNQQAENGEEYEENHAGFWHPAGSN